MESIPRVAIKSLILPFDTMRPLAVPKAVLVRTASTMPTGTPRCHDTATPIITPRYLDKRAYRQIDAGGDDDESLADRHSDEN